jgi:hypothetical protein
MPRSSNKRTGGSEKATETLGRAEHAQMEQRIARGSIARQTAEAAFARRWGLSFRLCAG